MAVRVPLLFQPNILNNFQVRMQGPYDQFLLFGDSLTQQSCSQAEGFAFTPALQDGMTTEPSPTFFCEKYPYESRASACVSSRLLIARCAS